MISRTLPMDEWAKISNDDLAGYLRYAHPEDVRIAVVEDQGKIIGRCLVLKMTHLEGLWTDQEHRNAGVSSALLKQVVKTAREFANETVIAGAADGDDRMYSLMARLGAERIPCSFFALGLGG
jgi:GNAT superfamily N-acetyltransferase